MTEQPAQGFAGLLRQLRAAVRLTQEELAEAAGLSPRSVSDLERGINRTARKDTAESLAGALGLAEPVRAVFVAAARGRADAADVLAALDEQARRSAAPEVPAATRGAAWPGCPYLGLMPFQERDARIYYGRDELVAGLVQRLTDRLDRAGILLMAGESGAGKSSLLRAGLIPRLAAGALGPGSERWPRRVVRPTANPLRALATALADVANADADSVYRSPSAAPAEAPMLVELAVRTATGRGAHTESGGAPDSAAAAAPRLVLIVDQFEELFTAGDDAEADRMKREGFITALHAAASGSAGPRQLPPALVILAIRADFLGRLIAYPPLKAALDAGPFTVGPMSEAELRLAMTGPAAEANLAIEPALVEAAIAELGKGAGAQLGSGVLPLISQAMAATWEHHEGDELTLRAYRRAGGVAYAVNCSAQAAYYALTDRQQDAARLVFTQGDRGPTVCIRSQDAATGWVRSGKARQRPTHQRRWFPPKRIVSDFTSRLRGNAPAGICRDGQHHARFGGGGCGPERCDKGSRCATPAIPAGQAMTQVMTARLSQPGIAGLLPAPSPGNRHLPSEAGLQVTWPSTTAPSSPGVRPAGQLLLNG